MGKKKRNGNKKGKGKKSASAPPSDSIVNQTVDNNDESAKSRELFAKMMPNLNQRMNDILEMVNMSDEERKVAAANKKDSKVSLMEDMVGLLRNGIIDEDDFSFSEEQKREVCSHNEALFKDHPSPADCDICFSPLPVASNEKTYKLCCGKIICLGCTGEMRDNRVRNEDKMKDNRSKRNGDLCPFCRVVTTNENLVDLVKKRIDLNDPNAFMTLSSIYAEGTYGQQKGRFFMAHMIRVLIVILMKGSFSLICCNQ